MASRIPRQRELPPVAEVQEHAAAAAELLKALANDRRLLVLCALVEGPLGVGEINERVALSQSALSQHLAVLRDAGIVTATRHAQSITYALAPGPALEVMKALYNAYCAPAARGARRPC
jgi:DNA-binding transcriptional ArsR family regulator